MTTKVTVDAHAGWDIEVVVARGEYNEIRVLETEVVPAGTVREFYIHSGMRLVLVEEIRK